MFRAVWAAPAVCPQLPLNLPIAWSVDQLAKVILCKRLCFGRSTHMELPCGVGCALRTSTGREVCTSTPTARPRKAGGLFPCRTAQWNCSSHVGGPNRGLDRCLPLQGGARWRGLREPAVGQSKKSGKATGGSDVVLRATITGRLLLSRPEILRW